MLTMPKAEQMAMLASHLALTSDLLEVPVNGEPTVMPTECQLQLLRPGEQEELDKMVTIACTLVYYEHVEALYDDVYALADEVLRAWSEGVLDD